MRNGARKIHPKEKKMNEEQAVGYHPYRQHDSFAVSLAVILVIADE